MPKHYIFVLPASPEAGPPSLSCCPLPAGNKEVHIRHVLSIGKGPGSAHIHGCLARQADSLHAQNLRTQNMLKCKPSIITSIQRAPDPRPYVTLRTLEDQLAGWVFSGPLKTSPKKSAPRQQQPLENKKRPRRSLCCRLRGSARRGFGRILQ